VEPPSCTASAWSSWHFWLATIGIVLYIASMWVAGVMQGLMWRERAAMFAIAR
jgi:cbb3-type cytochrome oxidase subunit 1